MHTTTMNASGRPATHPMGPLNATWLRELCLEAGADDVGFVELERPALLPE